MAAHASFSSSSAGAHASLVLPATLLGWVLGTALQLRQSALPSAATDMLLGCTALALLGLLALFGLFAWPRGAGYRCHPGVSALCGGLATLLIAFATADVRARLFTASSLDPALEGVNLTLVADIAAMPQRQPGALRLRVDVVSARQGGQPVQVPPLVQLGWYANEGSAAQVFPPLWAGERWSFDVRLKAPHGMLNPHGFDYELSAWEQGVQAVGSIRAARRLGEGEAHPVERARQHVRDAILARVADPREAGVIAALVTGDQAAIARADWDTYRATGVAHLMSISGLHVTMFAWLAGGLVGRLWRRSARLCLAWPAPQAATVAGVALAATYAVFSGLGVPAERTLCMLATLALLRLSGRRWPWPLAWGLAMAVVLAFDPWAWMQAGFWLSFVAVGVLFAVGDAPSSAPQPAPAGGSGAMHALRRLGGQALALMREQCIVSLALAPLSLMLFHQISLVGLLANLLAIPWVTLIVTPLAMAGVFVPPLWVVCALCVRAMNAPLGAAANLAWATLPQAAPPVLVGVAAGVGIVLLLMRWPWRWRALAVPLVLPLLVWTPPRPREGTLDLLALDVGQGSAVLVRTATHALLYDTGPRYGPASDAGERVIVPLLAALGERLDRVVLSHRDTDHVGGAQAVLRAQPAADLWSSLEESHPLRALRVHTPCAAGQAWTWDGVRFEMLHPLAQELGAGLKPNALSCVLKVSAPGGAVLLAGDIEAPQERALLSREGAEGLSADVLLVPHHGSKTSSTAAFLTAVRPPLAFAQAGYRNRFHHPAPPVVERYVALGLRFVQTPTCGAIHWTSEHAARFGCERQLGARYWHHRTDGELAGTDETPEPAGPGASYEAVLP